MEGPKNLAGESGWKGGKMGGLGRGLDLYSVWDRRTGV